jgi:TonB family protein
MFLISSGCTKAENANNDKPAKQANVALEVKPTETVVKQAEPAARAGKEIKPADGPALKSVTPPEGTILAGVLNEIAVSVPKPEYPPAAKAAKASGKVTVEVMVNEKGNVVASSVVSGNQLLWSAAGAAARATVFDPPLMDGKPVKMAGVLTFEFAE